MIGYNADVVINKLLALGVITRTDSKGWYYMADRGTALFDRARIYRRFTRHPELNGQTLMDRYLIDMTEVERALAGEQRPIRTINRLGYHSGSRDYGRYINAVPYDADGVRRTFGLEYEVYTLDRDQESDLAYLLDTLPAHITERDGSLGTNGVEIVFMPMGAQDYIRTVKTLADFIRSHGIYMCGENGNGAGMHTTYGVSNHEASKRDLQIRLNRYAMALAALATKPKIKEIFGRTFGHYRSMPYETTSMDHSNAFSCNGRPESCWECRLPNWAANPEKLVEFFRITETAFHRPFNASDFQRLYSFLGCTVE